MEKYFPLNLINSILDTIEENISDLEDLAVQTIHSKSQKSKKKTEKNDSLRDLWIISSNIIYR